MFTSTRLLRLIRLLPAGLVCSVAFQGLCQAGEGEADLFEFSPFTVEADEDLGYLPTSTLAGTRLRTDLKDIGASIDVMTIEFLDDIGAVTVDESFLYAAHLENPTETGQDSPFGPLAGSSDLHAGSGTRALGLSSPTPSRNYFPALLPLDRYNTERVVIARGPQAILFGLGSPSGVVNTNMKLARFENSFLEVRSRFDNWGSQRWEVDVNQPILKDSLAVRLAYLDDQQQFWLDPAWDDRIRKYGTLTWKPLKWMTFRLHRETFTREASVPGTPLPGDNVSYFYEATGGQLIDEEYDQDTSPFWLRNGPIGVSILFNSAGQSEPVFTQLDQRAIPRRTARIISWVSDPSSRFYNPDDPFFDPDWINIDDTRRSLTLKDDRYYPVYDTFLLGELHPTRQKGDFTTAFLELQLFEELLHFSDGFVELSYNKEEFLQRRAGVFSPQEFAIYVDPNRFLPGGELNPDAGKRFLAAAGGWMEEDQTVIEMMRLTASTTLDLTDRSNWLGRHRFGFHLSRSDDESNSLSATRTIGNIGGIIGGKNPQNFIGSPMAGPGSNWRRPENSRIPAMTFYLDEANGVFYPTTDMLPWGGPLDTWFVPTEDGVFGIYGVDPDSPGAWWPAGSVFQQIDALSASWQGWFDLGNWARLVTTYGYRKDRIRAKGRVSPGSFTNSFGETLTVDEMGIITETSLYAHYSVMPWDPDWGDSGDFSNDVVSGVLSLDPFMDRFFAGNFRASLNFNKSSNNTGLSADLDANGAFHRGQRGEGKNYGIRLELAQSKIWLAVNRWQVDLTGARAPDQVNGVRYDIRDIEDRWLLIEPDRVPEVVAATGGYMPDPNGTDLGYDDPNRFGVFGDQAAEGWTIDLVANPCRGLRIRFNLGKTRAVNTNVGSAWTRFVREVRQPLWANEIQWWDYSKADGLYRPVLAWDPHLAVDADANGVPDTMEDGDGNVYLTLGDPGNPTDVANILSGWGKIAMNPNRDLDDPETIEDRYLLAVEASHLLLAEGLEGLSNPTVREWRANATAAYTFQEGLLENWSLGGSIRYRDEQFIGAKARYVELTLSDGSTYSVATDDPTKPLYGEDFWFFDLMIGYSGDLTISGHRIGFGVQLNVRNLFDEDSTYTTDATSTGRPVRVSRNLPREVYLSTSIRF